ncbi:nucleotide exchange factor GrpE [Halobacteria archaeon HArc-curdl5-1]|uniref:Protein GrpE n=1 Tax=Halapricum hydrolyticum TaxID=2979991 RepID=A0AAE3LE87_9EURY|nr:nucleotide exchange factor GrpE [Halapricum hydrolyticum]MCU4725625.1 nucleotide exchange factor GrpE [Halapricum hydrolyticum]
MSEGETAEERVGDDQSADETTNDGEETTGDVSEGEDDASERTDGASETDDDTSVSEDSASEESADDGGATENAEPDVDLEDERAAEDLDVAEEVLEHVESSDPAEVADELATLRFEVEALEAERDDYEEEVESLQSRLKRKQADFENYKKRMKKRREQEKARATEDLVTRLLDVRDNLQRALEQDEDADIRDGIETTLKQFDRVLEDENVEPVEPEPGDEVDPERHEVLVRMDSDQPEGTIAQVHRPGYEMAGKVIRTAQVAVSDGDE